MSRRNHGFTLIELLVVIAIIAILAAILFPVFARARENARKANCMSNVKQITLGIMQYVQDYDERYPSTHFVDNLGYGRWVPAVEPYIKNKQVWACPSNKDTFKGDFPTHYASNPAGYAPFDYGINGRIGRMSLAQIDAVASTILLGESNLPDPYYWAHLYSGPVGCQSQPYGAWPHMDGYNLGLADGHCKWYHVPGSCNTTITGLTMLY